jgi:hypothetical protein
MRRIAAFGITAVLALGAVACSDDSGDDEESTDTEATESTDGPTGTADGPTGTAAPEYAEFCAQYLEAADVFIEAASGEDGAAGIDEVVEAYSAAAELGPEELQDDLQTVLTATEEAESAAELLSSSGDTLDASDRLTEWVEENCGESPAG